MLSLIDVLVDGGLARLKTRSYELFAERGAVMTDAYRRMGV